MGYAKVDDQNRIITWLSDKDLDNIDNILAEFPIYFTNEDYVLNTPVDSIQDFKIVSGVAVYDPTEETLEKIEEKERQEKINQYVEELIQNDSEL